MNSKILFVIAAAAVVGAYFYFDTSESLFGVVTQQFAPVNWDEITPRNIVKNAIPITIIDEAPNGLCKVSAENFDLIIDHRYFVNADKLAKELQYDSEDNTLILFCNQLAGETSKLEIWYATEEAENHATKYQYFVSEWDGNLDEVS